MAEKILYIGIDLGDKTTSMFYANSGTSDMVNPIQLPGCIGSRPLETTVCALRSGETKLVDSLAYYELDEISKIYTNFKYQPDVVKKTNPEQYKTMAQGINAFIRAIFENDSFKETMRPLVQGKDRVVFCIGYPTNWSNESVQEYKKLITGKDLRNYGVQQSSIFDSKTFMGVPMELRFEKESTGAYVYINNINSKERKWKIQAGGNVLVLDFGSSTVNVTALGKDSRHTLYSSGNNQFGGRQLDAVIAYDCLQLLPNNVRTTFFNLNRLNQGNPARLLMIGASHLKEKLSSQDACKENFDCMDVVLRYDVDKLQHAAYEIPLGKANEIVPDIVQQNTNISWCDALRTYLFSEKKKLRENGIRPEMIILTGGGAAMPVTQAICTLVFGKVQALDASESQCVIAQGLALAAKNADRSRAFQEEIKKFIEHDLQTLIRAEMSTLIHAVSGCIKDQVCSKVQDEIKRWRNGYVSTLFATKRNISQIDYSAISKSTAVQNAVNQWYKNTMRRTINSRLEMICKKYDARNFLLPESISFNLSDLRFSFSLSDIENEMFIGVLGSLAVILVGLLAFTPLGLPILIGLGIAALTEWGQDQIGELLLKIEDYHFPQILRNRVSDDKIRKAIKENEEDIEKAINKSITSNSISIASSLKSQIAMQIEAKMAEIQFELH